MEACVSPVPRFPLLSIITLMLYRPNRTAFIINHRRCIIFTTKSIINLLATDFFFQILAHPVFKM